MDATYDGTLPPSSSGHWQHYNQFAWAESWLAAKKKHLGAVGERSTWWSFISSYSKQINHWLTALCRGHYRFSPMSQYRVKSNLIRVWSYPDRLMLHCLRQLLKPTFKHLIAVECVHLSGPTATKETTQAIQQALNADGNDEYVIRYDIKSFYASIRHDILLNQLNQHYQDPILRNYFETIVTVPVDDSGVLNTPTQGIPKGSSLSPFFGALYLSPIDTLFTHRKHVFYQRFMNEDLILIHGKRRYQKAKKRLFKTLRELKLKVAPHNTYCGKLCKGFHFLGVRFEVSRNPQNKTQVMVGRLHKRTYQRAFDKVKAMHTHAVHPVLMQRYLERWAAWWQSAVLDNTDSILSNWLTYVKTKLSYELSWSTPKEHIQCYISRLILTVVAETNFYRQ